MRQRKDNSRPGATIIPGPIAAILVIAAIGGWGWLMMSARQHEAAPAADIEQPPASLGHQPTDTDKTAGWSIGARM